MRRWARVTALSGVGGFLALQLLGRRAGSTAAERRQAMPGDELVSHASLVTNHAATLNAPAERIWPWLTQMGWHLGGYYTPSWVDRLLFPDNWPSLDVLDPGLVRELRVGDIIPDGRPGTAEYVVDRVQRPHVLVLRSTTHIPPGWDVKHGVRFCWTWSFHLTDLPGGRTRVQTRVRGRGGPRWFIALYLVGIIPADYVMATGMLRGLRDRVEGSKAATSSGRAPWESRETPCGGP